MTKFPPKAVLFDLDGTLIDTAPDFIRIIGNMCQKYERTPPSDEAIREQVSAGAKAMIRLIFDAPPFCDESLLLDYRQQFLDLYQADICVNSQLFAGFDALLRALKAQGIAWGIVTNKPRNLAQALLHKLQLWQHCAVLVCPEDVTHTKPDPEPMFLAVKWLNEQKTAAIGAQDCVYVGDHIRDIKAGKAAGMTTVIAAYGYIPPEDKDLLRWGADAIVDSAYALGVLLNLPQYNQTKL